MFKVVGQCPVCGAPIYTTVDEIHSGSLSDTPVSRFTCMCTLDKRSRITYKQPSPDSSTVEDWYQLIPKTTSNVSNKDFPTKITSVTYQTS